MSVTPPPTSQKALIITLASTNKNKCRELQRCVTEAGLPVKLVQPENLADVDETGDTFMANARLKAEQCAPVPGSQWILAEDSGFVVNALAKKYGLDPFPGIKSNRWLTPEIRKALLGVSSDTPTTEEERNKSIIALLKDTKDRLGA
ncbi:MAG: non-canonical purine NTP pyrophosphatase, partial [Vampirovibrio sp.]|nr:non-canonical purine NTP pyrophosphatase [Vampirovibrio sp.]